MEVLVHKAPLDCAGSHICMSHLSRPWGLAAARASSKIWAGNVKSQSVSSKKTTATARYRTCRFSGLLRPSRQTVATANHSVCWAQPLAPPNPLNRTSKSSFSGSLSQAVPGAIAEITPTLVLVKDSWAGQSMSLCDTSVVSLLNIHIHIYIYSV